jgi:hypothetical protein
MDVNNKYKRVSANYRYRAWLAMLRRCSPDPASEKWKWYAARGIKVCDRWLISFDAFVDDMGERPSARHSIDRIDNNAGYSPDNCRWATWSEQARNRRPRGERENCIRVDGLSFTALAKLHGIRRKTLERRYREGKRGPDLIAPTNGPAVLR